MKRRFHWLAWAGVGLKMATKPSSGTPATVPLTGWSDGWEIGGRVTIGVDAGRAHIDDGVPGGLPVMVLRRPAAVCGRQRACRNVGEKAVAEMFDGTVLVAVRVRVGVVIAGDVGDGVIFANEMNTYVAGGANVYCGWADENACEKDGSDRVSVVVSLKARGEAAGNACNGVGRVISNRCHRVGEKRVSRVLEIGFDNRNCGATADVRHLVTNVRPAIGDGNQPARRAYARCIEVGFARRTISVFLVVGSAGAWAADAPPPTYTPQHRISPPVGIAPPPRWTKHCGLVRRAA